MTRVVNLRHEEFDVYIGRSGSGYDGRFGSPIRIGQPCPECRRVHESAGSTLGCYRVYLLRRVASDPAFRRDVAALRGCTLGCFCKPAPCHGDVLVDYLGESMKLEVLQDLQDVVASCEACGLHKNRTNPVVDRGSHDARLMFVGEGPGEHEDLQGLPFVGPSGKLLDELITQSMRLTLDDVYICNAVKCRPPNNRTPTGEEVSACGDYLAIQIEAVNPKVIVALGKTAALALGCDTGRGWSGRWGSYGAIPVMPTFHPSYLLRQNEAERAATWKQVSSHLRSVLAKLRE